MNRNRDEIYRKNRNWEGIYIYIYVSLNEIETAKEYMERIDTVWKYIEEMGKRRYNKGRI